MLGCKYNLGLPCLLLSNLFTSQLINKIASSIRVDPYLHDLLCLFVRHNS